MTFFNKIFRKKTTQQQAARPKAPEVVAVTPEQVAQADLATYVLTQTDTQICLTALLRINSEADFLRIATQHGIAQVRLAAAEQVRSLNLVQELYDHAKSRDKAVFRLAKTRLQQHRDETLRNEARKERIEQLLTQARYLKKVGYTPELSAKKQLLAKEWADCCADSTPAQQDALQVELHAINSLLEQHATDEKRAQQAQLAKETVQQEQQAALTAIKQVLAEANTLSANALTERTDSIQQAWFLAAQHQKAPESLSAEFNQVLHDVRNVALALQFEIENSAALTAWHAQSLQEHTASQLKQADHWLKQFTWPSSIAKPHWLTAIEERQNALREGQQEHSQTLKTKQAQTQQQLNELEQAINAGNLKTASKLSLAIHNSLRHLNTRDSAALLRQLKALNVRLDELRDWAGFATSPKKEALIVSMESLINADIAPPLLAEKIQTLQDEWKKLSVVSGDQELWERFRKAADLAFEPCKQYFAEQAKLRELYLQQRYALINELTHYEQHLNWEAADWKAVQKTLDTARNTFKTLVPVERGEHIKTQEQFSSICDRIYAHIKAHYDQNVAAKQQLIDQATELAKSENLQGITERVKELHTQWKAIGITPRAIDQRLWQLFREQCDAVFIRLDEQRNERHAKTNQAIADAEALVSNTLASLSDHSHDALTVLHNLKQQLQKSDLPKSVQQRLLNSVHENMQALETARNSQQLESLRAGRNGLLARLKHFHGDDDQWQNASNEPLPAGFNQALFEQARTKCAQHEDARDLCILMEIVADKPSPDDVKQRRLELQVQRLADGLGKGLNRAEESKMLIERWLYTKANKEQTSRFVQAVEAIEEL